MERARRPPCNVMIGEGVDDVSVAADSEVSAHGPGACEMGLRYLCREATTKDRFSSSFTPI